MQFCVYIERIQREKAKGASVFERDVGFAILLLLLLAHEAPVQGRVSVLRQALHVEVWPAEPQGGMSKLFVYGVSERCPRDVQKPPNGR